MFVFSLVTCVLVLDEPVLQLYTSWCVRLVMLPMVHADPAGHIWLDQTN